jgi:hypothetical protein
MEKKGTQFVQWKAEEIIIIHNKLTELFIAHAHLSNKTL